MTTHGHTKGRDKSPEYNTWVRMRSRCNSPSDKKYPWYGARGIKVCERWDSYVNFLADMGPRPSNKHSIDRYPDNTGDYEPTNCRWATALEQANNRPDNRFMNVEGNRVTIAEASRQTGINVSTLKSRIYAGCSDEEAVQSERRPVPIGARKTKLSESDVRAMRSAVGVSHRELARQFCVDKKTIAQIIHREIWRHI